jgi:membrane protease subunit (stomatin/prohibitin family)
VGDAVEDIYGEYRTQESFTSKVITNDVRSVVRNVPGAYSTMDVLTRRAEVEKDIRTALEERWADRGVVVESVALQEIRYSDDVKKRLDEAQAARIAVDKAEADQERVRVEAETELIRQQGIADANAVLTESLTPEVLQQKYIDALREAGAVYVVPEGSQPLVQVPATKK